MSALLNVSLRVDKLPREKFVMGKDGAVYLNFTVAVNDEPNQFGIAQVTRQSSGG